MDTKLKIDNLEVFYIFPAAVFISYGSEIHLVEQEKRQRQPRSAPYRQRWDLIQSLAGHAQPLIDPEQADPEKSTEAR